MRRRSKRAPNQSESTGKIGQEIPTNQPAPLVPSYVDDFSAAAPPRTPARTAPARPEPPKSAPARNESPQPDTARNRQSRNEPSRPDAQRAPQRDSAPRPAAPAPVAKAKPLQPLWNEPASSGRLLVETQPELPNQEPISTSPTAPKGYVVLAIGLPGSGKTTWFQRRGVTPLSSDLLRGILFDDVEEQRYQGLVFSTLRTLLRARLVARMPWNYVDATNLSIHERRQWIKMAKSFGYETQAVFFDVPLEICLERNSQRDRSVSEEIMRKMAEKLKAPAFEEGFSKITVVRVKNNS